VAEVAPDFARMVIEFAFGDLYSRKSLDLKSRELIAIAALAVSGNAGPQLRVHVESAERVGISRAEVVEALMQVSLYAGFPAALNALAECHDLLTDQDCLAGACR
jgi:4-carboxymuconolactone decarboxylase